MKAERRAGRRTEQELQGLLDEDREFLLASAASYDGGFLAEAKRMAVVLRVLLHDTATSISVLGQMNVKDRWAFTDTADPIRPTNMASTAGLVIMKVTWGVGGEYVPPLDMLSPDRIKPPASFAGWWNNPVMNLQGSRSWCRRQFVLELANKEGGAHVDPALTPRYDELSRKNALGWAMVHEDSTVTEFAGNPVFASVRQIAYEVLDTLDRHTASANHKPDADAHPNEKGS